MTVLCILRGPSKDADGTYRCPCCQDVQYGPDAFVSHLCWPCGFGENCDCTTCVTSGVPFNRFRKGRKLHRLRKPIRRSRFAVAVCGYRVPRSEVGQATAVIDRFCKHCWPEEQS